MSESEDKWDLGDLNSVAVTTKRRLPRTTTCQSPSDIPKCQ